MSISNNPIVNISIMGVGGAGIKTLYVIDHNNFKSVNFTSIDSDKKLLDQFGVDSKILLDQNKTINGHISSESIEKIKEKLLGTQLLILTAGLGGQTGSNIVPIIAKIAKDLGIITIAIVTTPFSYEGDDKNKLSNNSINEIKRNTDCFINISNNRIINNYPDIAAIDAFKLINNILKNCIKTFIELISRESIINISIADLISSLKNRGEAYIGFGKGIGRNKVMKAINNALNSKIIDKSFKRANNAILNIVGDETVTMQQINEIIDILKTKLNNKKTNIVFNFNVDKKLRNEIQLSIIATFSNEENKTIENKKLYNSQELLLEIGNTLENELNGYITGELDLQKDEPEVEKMDVDQFDDKDQENFTITNKSNDEDDDIPFFLK